MGLGGEAGCTSLHFASPKTWSRAWAGPVYWPDAASLSSFVSETDREEIEISQLRRLDSLPGTRETGTGVEQNRNGRGKYWLRWPWPSEGHGGQGCLLQENGTEVLLLWVGPSRPGRLLALRESELPLLTRPQRPAGHCSARPRCGASLPGLRITTARPRAKSGNPVPSA